MISLLRRLSLKPSPSSPSSHSVVTPIITISDCGPNSADFMNSVDPYVLPTSPLHLSRIYRPRISAYAWQTSFYLDRQRQFRQSSKTRGQQVLPLQYDYNDPLQEPDEWHFPVNPDTWVDNDIIDQCPSGMARPVTLKKGWNWAKEVGRAADWLVAEYEAEVNKEMERAQPEEEEEEWQRVLRSIMDDFKDTAIGEDILNQDDEWLTEEQEAGVTVTDDKE